MRGARGFCERFEKGLNGRGEFYGGTLKDACKTRAQERWI